MREREPVGRETPQRRDRSAPGAPTAGSAWAPLGIGVFRVLWVAQLVSNIGTWMQTVGAQWFLVEASASAAVVALVQTASLAPALLFSIFAGALADSLDRRKLLIWGTLLSAIVGGVLTVVSATGALQPWSLLAFTFLFGVLATLTGPAWQAIQPELVPREMIPAASGLGSITVNGARAVGPALAGFLVAALGVPAVFATNALSFVLAIAALVWWRRPAQEGLDDRELIGPATRAGLRYVRSAGLIRRIFLRSALFALPASGIWALLPLVASRRLGLQSSGYGILLGALGIGALIGVVLLPLLRKTLSDNAVLAVSATAFAAGVAASAVLPLGYTLAGLILAGAAWIGTLTVLNAALQLTLPQWVRSRGSAFYILVFMGSQAAGSLLWGVVAQNIGTSAALLVSAGLLLVTAVSVLWWGLRPGTGVVDRSVAMTWPTPTLMLSPSPSDGPLTVRIRYEVDEEKDVEFREAMRQVERSRRRTGATRWRLYRSAENPTTLIEVFTVPSWSEYRRQQTSRLTGKDREIQDTARSLAASVPSEEHLFPATLGAPRNGRKSS